MAKKLIKYFCIMTLILFLNLFLISFVIAQNSQDTNQTANSYLNNPYKASVRINIRMNDGKRAFCSGTIIKINKNTGLGTVLTAGHCLQYGASSQYSIDYGPGTNQVHANYVGHRFDGDAGQNDIGLLSVPVDLNDPPGVVDIIDNSYSTKINDLVYHVGYPGGNDISVVGTKVIAMSDPYKGSGFSILNFPPKGGRSGGGVFNPTKGDGNIYTRGKIFGIVTNVDLLHGTCLYANTKQIFGFVSQYGININS